MHQIDIDYLYKSMFHFFQLVKSLYNMYRQLNVRVNYPWNCSSQIKSSRRVEHVICNICYVSPVDPNPITQFFWYTFHFSRAEKSTEAYQEQKWKTCMFLGVLYGLAIIADRIALLHRNIWYLWKSESMFMLLRFIKKCEFSYQIALIMHILLNSPS